MYSLLIPLQFCIHPSHSPTSEVTYSHCPVIDHFHGTALWVAGSPGPVTVKCQLCMAAISPSLSYSRRRQFHLQSRKASKQREEKLKIVPDPPLNPKSDWIGPPDPKSNIRPYKFYIPDDETKWQKEFRLRREDNQKWNHEFWLEHNESFFQKKEEFVKKKLQEKATAGETDTTLSPEEMSEFYRKFLDEKFEKHMQYNKDWYKRNISILWPALKVSLEKLWKR